jgi:predicted  nucleic acid-binding Zn-ribbon protein
MSMPLSARRVPQPLSVVERFPERSLGVSQVVLSAHETAAVSTMLRQAKGAIASLRQRVAGLESELDAAEARARAAEEGARVAAACRAGDHARAQALVEELAQARAGHEAFEAEIGEALRDREHRMWSAEARAQEFERCAADAEERAAAAEAREWEAKARLARAREALGE